MKTINGCLVLAFLSLAACEKAPFPTTATEHSASIHEWQQQRTAGLQAEDGWLSLVGLYWLEPGDNTFGSDPGNDFVLANAALPAHAGTFSYTDGAVRFHAAADARITLDGEAVTALDLVDDHREGTTVLAAGSLRFYAIARAGRHGIRVRDLASPARLEFRGVEYFPVSLEWRKIARFEPWPEPRAIRIINVLGMADEMASPGELVFEHGGEEFRVAALADAGDEEWFIMIADATSGRETYGAGRYLYIKPPVDGHTVLDFNKAYNPPCAFTALATCPLPPPSNRLALRVAAGEKNYAGH